jgi:rubrerythrin
MAAGPGAAESAAAPPRPTDGAIIASAVGLEQRSALAYEVAARSGLLGARLQALVERIGRQEAEHAAALRTALEALGGAVPRRPETIGELAGASSQAQVAGYLLRLESASVSVYQRSLGTLTGPKLVQTVASIMAVEAQHLALIRQALGRESVRGPFERG